MEFSHKSVLLWECIDALNIRPNGIYLDGTLGGGGHSLEICRRLTNGRLIGVDRDDVETDGQMAGDDLEEAPLGRGLADDPRDLGPEVARVVFASETRPVSGGVDAPPGLPCGGPQ